jgi:uncharacterized protein YeaO (DUF488 family)
LKRVYKPASRADGTRILVDRLWPRGLRKEDAVIDHWFKDLAPSTALVYFTAASFDGYANHRNE